MRFSHWSAYVINIYTIIPSACAVGLYNFNHSMYHDNINSIRQTREYMDRAIKGAYHNKEPERMEYLNQNSAWGQAELQKQSNWGDRPFYKRFWPPPPRIAYEDL